MYVQFYIPLLCISVQRPKFTSGNKFKCCHEFSSTQMPKFDFGLAYLFIARIILQLEFDNQNPTIEYRRLPSIKIIIDSWLFSKIHQHKNYVFLIRKWPILHCKYIGCKYYDITSTFLRM